MKKLILIFGILGCTINHANANETNQPLLFKESLIKVQNTDSMPIRKFTKIDAKNHLILVKFIDKKVRKSILSSPEKIEKVKELKKYGYSKQIQKMNLNEENRDYALSTLNNIYMKTGILLKHIRSNSLGFDQFHVKTSNIDSVIDSLMNTGYFEIVEVEKEIKINNTETIPISDLENRNSGDVNSMGYNINGYGDSYAYLQEYLDEQQEGDMGSHSFLKALEYIKNNNNLNRKIRIAVIDTGYLEHEDQDNIIEGADFVSGYSRYHDCNTYDDTNQGLDVICTPENYKEKTRDLNPTDKSWLFPPLDENGIPTGDGEIFINGHGLAVSTTIAAKINDIGIIGALGDENSEIIHARGLGYDGGLSSDISDAIIWSSGGSVPGFEDISEPVDIINLSLGGISPCHQSSFYQSAINFARSQGVVVVAAAGNSSIDASRFTPANCDGVLSVGANNFIGDVSSFSNYGDTVDITFRGESLLVGSVNTQVYKDPESNSTCQSNNGVSRKSCYAYISGTSFSAPLASAAIGILKIAKPELSNAEIISILKNTAPKFEETANGDMTRRSKILKNAGVGNVLNAITTPFDRLFIDNLSAKHMYSAIDTEFENVYFQGLLEYSQKDKICSSYKFKWNNFSDSIDDLTYTIYGNNSPTSDILSSNNSDIIASNLIYPTHIMSVLGYSRFGVQANNGEVFEFDLSNANIPEVCL